MEEGWIDTKGCPCNMQYCTGRSMSQRARIMGGGYWIFQCLADVEHLTYDACTIRGQKHPKAVPDQQLCINCRSWKPGRWTEERTIWRSTFAGCSHWRWGHYPLRNGNSAEARKPGSRFGDDWQPSQPLRFALGWIPVSKVQPMVLWTKMLAGSWDPHIATYCNHCSTVTQRCWDEILFYILACQDDICRGIGESTFIQFKEERDVQFLSVQFKCHWFMFGRLPSRQHFGQIFSFWFDGGFGSLCSCPSTGQLGCYTHIEKQHMVGLYYRI